MARSEQAECLFDSKPKAFRGKLPGQLVGADEQCQKLFGPSSGLCKVIIRKYSFKEVTVRDSEIDIMSIE